MDELRKEVGSFELEFLVYCCRSELYRWPEKIILILEVVSILAAQPKGILSAVSADRNDNQQSVLSDWVKWI
jgi:hypothetical protein